MTNSLDAVLLVTFQRPGKKTILNSGQSPSLALLRHILLCALALTIKWRIVLTKTRAENLVARPWSALTSTNPRDVNNIPAISHTIAVPADQAATDQSTPVIAARKQNTGVT